MSKLKKIGLPILVFAIIAGYVAGVSFLINSLIKPITIETLEFGVYIVSVANNEIDLEDENNNTIYNSINSQLLNSTQSELNELKLITLYKVSNEYAPIPTNDSETIILEISDNIAKETTLNLIKVNADESIVFVEINVEKRIRENNNGREEEYSVIIFDVEEGGYYGLVSERGIARYTFLIVLISIIGLVILFFVLFIVIKSQRNNDKYTAEIEPISTQKDILEEEIG